MTGKIIRGVGGFYYVHAGGRVYECRAKGIFRKDGIRPLPGDLAEIAVLDEAGGKGNLERILPRKNALIRPAVANVDQAMVIFAFDSPKPNFNLLDRFLVTMGKNGIEPVILFNKKDLAREGQQEEILRRYENAGYGMLFVSAKLEEELPAVRAALKGKTTTVAGPSGVGKSSLINRLQTEEFLQTGEVSEKIERGRHTTRHTQLLPVEEDTYILDTPGFSSIDLSGIRKEELGDLFPEIAVRADGCRFAGCSHLTEPDCAVKEALAEGKISRERYENYRLFYEELKNRREFR
ncbi:MAG TPA: ribosome small subunit-dependent GTPase A [Candidatus Eisenbergiella merdigallinarum]|uniref:Small ribosomal subunit biogenesis GTPase RsgA n=1 Tax=Candidatus Eisenbergiella merdigallinarum TaxID=2838552 RepID=A0A9D2SD49_9FIRM|nr:ribosome small subunit-dependent GTPase A [Candidatus Eisenbergiella merdigallinarum]